MSPKLLIACEGGFRYAVAASTRLAASELSRGVMVPKSEVHVMATPQGFRNLCQRTWSMVSSEYIERQM